MIPPYTVATCCAFTPNFYVAGPDFGGICSYGSASAITFSDENTAIKAKTLANNGYTQGYRQAQADMQKALGIHKE